MWRRWRNRAKGYDVLIVGETAHMVHVIDGNGEEMYLARLGFENDFVEMAI